jgi:8-oxo-dGTP pyrophosphatase MutT (NUDIX family)
LTAGLPQVAAVVLLRDDGAALLQHRDDKPGLSHANMWVPPGGHADAGEPLDDCARREFLEETGYRLDEIHLFAQFLDNHPEGFPPLELFVYWSCYDGRQSVTCHEGQALAFIPREDAHRYAIPPYLRDIWDQAVRLRQAARAGL